MATAIRLKRGGRTHAPYYRVVVMDSRTRARGREVDVIGYHQPCARPDPVTEIDGEKALKWLSSGARPSDTVRDILSRKGILKAFVTGEPLPKPPEPEVPAEPETEEASAEPVAEAEEASAEPVADTEEAPEAPTE